MKKLISHADRIFVAGHRGMAGSAICRALQSAGYGDAVQGGAILTAPRSELDLPMPRRCSAGLASTSQLW
jgi:GDP-L-fucose synthase